MENALLHGIQNSPKQFCKINISAVSEGDDIIICVSDDGIGMEEDKVKELLIRNMEEAMQMKVNLESDLNEGETWFDLK